MLSIRERNPARPFIGATALILDAVVRISVSTVFRLQISQHPERLQYALRGCCVACPWKSSRLRRVSLSQGHHSQTASTKSIVPSNAVNPTDKRVGSRLRMRRLMLDMTQLL
jgi:hypothetical protein